MVDDMRSSERESLCGTTSTRTGSKKEVVRIEFILVKLLLNRVSVFGKIGRSSPQDSPPDQALESQ